MMTHPAITLEPEGKDWQSRFICDIRSREMASASALFKRHVKSIEAGLQTDEVPSAAFIDAAARLLDRDTTHMALVETLINRFHIAYAPKTVTTPDWIHISLAAAIVVFIKNDFPAAVAALDFVVTFADRAGDDDLRAIGRYYLARALSRMGKNDRALAVIDEADRHMQDKRSIAGGLIKMVSCWIRFSRDSVEEAEPELWAAKAVLWNRDYLEDANMVSLEGRFARQKGDFARAIERARRAIAILDAHGASEHANAVRCHVHLALALMLQARATGTLDDPDERQALEVQIHELLSSAKEICDRHNYPRVLDRVHYFRAVWLLMIGQDAAAAREAIVAHTVAESCHDHVLMAHALIVQCQCARHCHDPHAARHTALEAQVVASKTDNRRVKIRASICRAFVESDPPTENLKVAAEIFEKASGELRDSDRDYLRWECEELAAQIERSKCRARHEQLDFPRTVDDLLRVGNLDAVLDDVKKQTIAAVHARVGTTQGTAKALNTTRDRVRRICPWLKH
jgi:tetratricopeptide (TPR) repeat protein